MENTIQAEIKKLEEKEQNGALVSGSTVAAICEITKDFGEKVAVRFYTLARLGKTQKGWKVFATDFSEQIKDGVYPKETVAKWEFFAKELFGESPDNFVGRFITFKSDPPQDVEDFIQTVVRSNVDEQPISNAVFN